MRSGGKKTFKRAVGLLSGGLDSTIAAKLMLEQGVEVLAINFTSPFCTCTPKKAGCAAVITAVKELGSIPLRRVALGDPYLQMVREPKHGYGAGMNPCIDCRIMKIRKAGDYMHEIGASFLFTGEVLGQRPMSQHKQAIELIDRESGLEGYILRPLSAAHFKPTIPEHQGWVDRSKLLGISGRSRKEQIRLAHEKGIRDYPCPAGGCLLTDKNFADRMRDYFRFTRKPSVKDIPLLKVGRHFRLPGGGKVIVGRNEQECKTLKRICPDTDHLLCPVNFSGPVVVFQGGALSAAVDKMLAYTNRTLPEDARVAVRCGDRSEVFSLEDLCRNLPGFAPREHEPSHTSRPTIVSG